MHRQVTKYFFSTCILNGIKVLDLSRILVGPFASQMLSDFGADVIKVESFDGDETRKWGPPYNNKTSTYFLSLNRNKKSIQIDLSKDEGKQIIYDLTAKSDIFLENFSFGVTERLKIDYSTLQKINPKLIYARVSGFGDKGPLATYPGFDAAIQAYSGLMHITGSPEGPPTKIGVALTDVLSGYSISCGVLAALIEREKTGKGQFVTTSLLETAVSSLVNIGSGWLNGEHNANRLGNDHPSIVPYGTYKVKNDKYLMIACGTDGQFQKLLSILSLSHLLDSPSSFASNDLRVQNRVELNKLLQEKLIDFNLDDIVQKLKDLKIPGGPINDVKTALSNDQVKALGLVEEVNSEKHNNLKLVRCPITFSESKTKKMTAPPDLGEHKDEILEGILGYKREKIEKMLSAGIIR